MKIPVVQSVLRDNDARAGENRRHLQEAGVLAVNIMSAPGSGKTTLLETTIGRFDPARCGVLVGDLQTTRDAERLGAVGAATVQINTGKGCHLSALQVAEGLRQLDLKKLSVVFIENIGNMVCPTGVDLGEHFRVALLSTPEGDDKVAKYPTLFQAADVILLTKTDLAELLQFDRRRVRADLARLNTHAPLIEISCRSGAGLPDWFAWLAEKIPNHPGLTGLRSL